MKYRGYYLQQTIGPQTGKITGYRAVDKYGVLMCVRESLKDIKNTIDEMEGDDTEHRRVLLDTIT